MFSLSSLSLFLSSLHSFNALSLTYSLSLSLSLSFCLALSLALSVLPSFRSLSLSGYFFLSFSSVSLYVHIRVDIHADVERGMAEEHLQQPDSKEGVTTNNYGVRYTLPCGS